MELTPEETKLFRNFFVCLSLFIILMGVQILFYFFVNSFSLLFVIPFFILSFIGSVVIFAMAVFKLAEEMDIN